MIYYAHINEDNFVERQILNNGSYEDLFCIAGSGERLLALLDHPSLKRVHIIDNNIEALYLSELKLVALQAFPVATYLDFIGLNKSKVDRIALLEKIKHNLSKDAVQFWQKPPNYIRQGILHIGHFEKFLSTFRPFLKMYLGPNFNQCFTTPLDQCKSFPHKRWALIRWFFSKRWVYRLGGNKDIAFISKEGQQHLIPDALQQTLLDHHVHKNPLFHLVFNGHLNEMPKEHLPPSMNMEILQKIKHILQSGKLEIHYHAKDMLAFAKSFDFTSSENNFYSLSDLLSFVDGDYVQQLIKIIRNRAHRNSTLVLRAFIRNRLSEAQIVELEKEFGELKDLSPLENTNMYQVYEISIKDE